MSSEIIDIQDLARLYLKTQKPFGEGHYADNVAFEKAFNNYCDNHEHLVELYPDKTLRSQELAVRVRAFAKRLIEKGEVDPNKPKSKTTKVREK